MIGRSVSRQVDVLRKQDHMRRLKITAYLGNRSLPLSCWINLKATPTSNFQPIILHDPGFWYKFTYWRTNSADPDQLASSEATDLDLHCLQRQGIFGFSRYHTRDKMISLYYHTRAKMIKYWCRASEKMILHWYRTSAKMISHWYHTSAQMIKHWYRIRAKKVSHCYHTSAKMIKHWYNTIAKMILHWYKTNAKMISASYYQSCTVVRIVFKQTYFTDFFVCKARTKLLTAI